MRTRLRQWRHRLAAAVGVARDRALGHYPAPSPRRIGAGRPYRPVAGGARQYLQPGCFWEAHTGPNPTDRTKLGIKRHVLSDGRPGNAPGPAHYVRQRQRYDPNHLPARCYPAIHGPRGQPRKRPQHLQGDRGYGSAANRCQCRQRKVQPQLASPGQPHGSGLGKTRWVIEQTHAWYSQFRRLRVCYEKTLLSTQAFHAVATILIIGKVAQAEELWVRGRAKAGTTRFYPIAAAYLVLSGLHVTLALRFVPPDDGTVSVLDQLLSRVKPLRIRVAYLLLDKGFDSIAVTEYLTYQHHPTLIACTIQGMTGGTRAFCQGRRSYRTTHTFIGVHRQGVTATVAVCRVFTMTRRTYRLKRWVEWRLFTLIHLDLSLRYARQLYREPFGIETSYRCAGQMQGWTTANNPAYRFVLLALAFVLLTVWGALAVTLHPSAAPWTALAGYPRFQLTRLTTFIRRALEQLYGCIQTVETVEKSQITGIPMKKGLYFQCLFFQESTFPTVSLRLLQCPDVKNLGLLGLSMNGSDPRVPSAAISTSRPWMALTKRGSPM